MEVQKSIKHHVCEKNYIWNPSTCASEIDKHLKSIIGDSADEMSMPKVFLNSNNKNAIHRMD